MLRFPRHASLTASFAQPLKHIARESSSSMLPNTVLTRSQLDKANPGFETPDPVIGYGALSGIFGGASWHTCGQI